MKCAGEGDDARAAGGGAGDLDGVLGGFCAGREEDRLGRAGDGGQCIEALGQFDIGLVHQHLEAGVGELRPSAPERRR